MHIAAFYEYSEYIYSINCYYIHCLAKINYQNIFISKGNRIFLWNEKGSPGMCPGEP